MQETNMDYPQACHYGALMHAYGPAGSPAAASVCACRCSFWRVHPVPATSDPAGTLGCQVTDAPLLDDDH